MRNVCSSESQKLLNCPFCGGDAEITKWHEGYFVECREQRCGGTIGAYKTEEEAIEAWNTRAERTCTILKGEGEYSEFSLSCGHYVDGARPNYCPSCGARVISEVE